LVETQSASLARRWWHSRLGYRFFVEAAFMVGLYFVYKIVRLSVRDQAGEAFANARTVIDFERGFKFFTEPDLQRLVVNHPWLAKPLNLYYVGAHFPITIACLAWLYVRRPLAYVSTRRIVIVASAIAMIIHVTYPLAPPRMLPEFGFSDLGQLFGPAAYGHGAVFGNIANEFAAMPSLHFGWAIIMAVTVVRYGRSPLRWIIVAHPMLTTAAIVLTANHYWLDVLVAGAVIALIYAFASLVSRLRPGGRVLQSGESSDDEDDAVIDLRTPEDLGALGQVG
jgi:hypothetical protein